MGYSTPLGTMLRNLTYWKCKGGRETENLRNCFLIFFSDDVTQTTPETFTEDPSKLHFCLFVCLFAVLLGIDRLRVMSI